MINKILKDLKIDGFRLVVSVVSTGNAGQLTADLFIETLKMNAYAQLWNSSIIPLLGKSAFNDKSKDVTTASEMFISEKHKLIVLQTRTPITSALLPSYLKEVLDFVQTEKIREIIILTSAFSHEQHFIGRNQFELIANAEIKLSAVEGFSECSNAAVSGSGYALKLHAMATERNIPSVIFYKFVSEGDNVHDAVQLCQKVNNYLKVLPQKTATENQITAPVSWKHLFGHNVNPEIY